jgi:hypothetical protein
VAEYEAQCVVWQTALNPVIALRTALFGRLVRQRWLGGSFLDAELFLDLMAGRDGYGQAWGFRARAGVKAGMCLRYWHWNYIASPFPIGATVWEPPLVARSSARCFDLLRVRTVIE